MSDIGLLKLRLDDLIFNKVLAVGPVVVNLADALVDLS